MTNWHDYWFVIIVNPTTVIVEARRIWTSFIKSKCSVSTQVSIERSREKSSIFTVPWNKEQPRSINFTCSNTYRKTTQWTMHEKKKNETRKNNRKREREEKHKYAINELKKWQIMIQRKCKNYALNYAIFLINNT